MYFKSNARVDKVKIENLTTEVESLKLKSQLTESLQSELQTAQLKIEELEKESLHIAFPFMVAPSFTLCS